MNTADAKRILETALICSTQPLPVRELRVLFDDELGADTIKALLIELQDDWAQRGVELVQRGQRLALPEPARDARSPRPPASRKAAALHPRHARNAGHHRLPPAGHARRHGRHPRRHHQLADPQAARRPRLGRGDRPPRDRRPAGAVRDHAAVPGRPGPRVARPVARCSKRRRSRRADRRARSASRPASRAADDEADADLPKPSLPHPDDAAASADAEPRPATPTANPADRQHSPPSPTHARRHARCRAAESDGRRRRR